jgi:hypothetical protein
MGKILDFGYKSPHNASLVTRGHTAPAAAKTSSPEPTAVPVERVTKARKAAAVSNAKSDAKLVSNGAARIARWRAKQDPEVRKQQNREAVQRSRAKKKAGKAVGS